MINFNISVAKVLCVVLRVMCVCGVEGDVCVWC